MSISTQPAPSISHERTPEVIVEPAQLRNVPSIWVIYHSGRVASQANAEIGLSEADMKAAFVNPRESFFGKTEADFIKVIDGQVADQAILAASIPEEFPSAPIGIARPSKERGKSWLHNVYVSPVAQGMGAGSALVEAGLAWHDGEPVFLKAASYNTYAQGFYASSGFEETGMTSAYSIGGKIVPQVILRHPGA